MVKIEFKNGEVKEFKDLKEAGDYEKQSGNKFKRIISK